MTAPAIDPWAEATERLRFEIARYPYLSILAAGGLGCLLAGDLALRLLPGLASLGARVALATVLPTVADALRELAAPEL